MAKTKSMPKKNPSKPKANDDIGDITGETIKENILSEQDFNSARDRCMKVGDGTVGPKINYMLKSRFRVLYVRTSEESRVVDFFKDLSLYLNKDLFQWDCDRGLLSSSSLERVAVDNSEVNEGDPAAILAHILDHATKQSSELQKNRTPGEAIYLLLDYHVFLDGMPIIDRKIKEFSNLVSTSTIIIIAPIFVCPPTLEKIVTLIDFPIPSYAEIKDKLHSLATEVSSLYPSATKAAKEQEEELVKSVSGLTMSEAENAYAMSIVSKQCFDIPTILDEKKQMIQKSGILQYYEPRFTFDDIGGLGALKDWLLLRKLAFKEDARKFGLPVPKGVMLIGIPGAGKSMVCDALSSAYKMPLLRLDFGAVFSSHVGDSEQNIRNCLQIAESISPVILWMDEIEKGIGGIESSNSTDGGVTSRVVATMLTWMQDKKAPVFVICTANNISSIPPEFMRAGRFDEIFFIDLPNDEQREDVVYKLLSRKGRDPSHFDIPKVVSCSKNYTPVEIEKGIDNALFVAYANGKRKVSTADVIGELKKFPPLYNARREEIESMREWALGDNNEGGRAVLANTSTQASKKNFKPVGRLSNLDI